MSALYYDCLLGLPETSDAFSAHPKFVNAPKNKGPEKQPISVHPRKTPRLTRDADSASASRSRGVGAPFASGNMRSAARDDGDVIMRDAADEDIVVSAVLRVEGAPYKPAPLAGQYTTECYNLVTRFLRYYLTKPRSHVQAIAPPPNSSFENIFSACRTIISVTKDSGDLYDQVKIQLERCVGELAQELDDKKEKGVQWIKPFNETCAWFEERVGMLRKLLAYLDHEGRGRDQKDLRSLAYDLFANRIFHVPRMSIRLSAGIEEWAQWERENGGLTHELCPEIKSLITHLRTHSMYFPAFESPFLKMTTAYYMDESSRLMKALRSDPAEFMKRCLERVKQEVDRAKEMFVEDSWEKVRAACEMALFEPSHPWVARDAVPMFMDDEDLQKLDEMYTTFTRVKCADEILRSFKHYIHSTVVLIVTDIPRDGDMVERLLNFKAFAEKAANTAFVDYTPSSTNGASTSTNAPQQYKATPNVEYGYAIRDGFQAGFSKRRNKPAEMIAKYLDRAMRKGQKSATDTEFMTLLEKTLQLYRFTEDKDVFRTYYMRALAKRLLLSRSANDAFEVAVLKKLTDDYDPEFSKGEVMFKDMALSRDLVTAYRESVENRYPAPGDKGKRKAGSEDGPKATFMVLQASSWPFTPKDKDADLPPYMSEQLSSFAEFYKKKHSNRVLNWDHALGNASVIGNFKGGKKELLVTLYQAIVLLQFNENAGAIGYNEIKIATRMPDMDLKRTLQSLACGKQKVLRKKPIGADVNESDTFYFNGDYTNPRHQVRIDSIQVKETPEENKRTEACIEADRKQELDAAIVRIMKAKKKLAFERIKTEVIIAVKNRFVPEIKQIKQRVDYLVENEYLKRDEDVKDVFIYLA